MSITALSGIFKTTKFWIGIGLVIVLCLAARQGYLLLKENIRLTIEQEISRQAEAFKKDSTKISDSASEVNQQDLNRIRQEAKSTSNALSVKLAELEKKVKAGTLTPEARRVEATATRHTALLTTYCQTQPDLNACLNAMGVKP